MSRCRVPSARMVGLLTVLSLVSFGLGACMDTPEFGVGPETASGAPSSDSTAGSRDGMVLVPAVMVVNGGPTPAARGPGKDDDDDDKSKGKGKDGGSGGGSSSGSSGGSSSGGSSGGGSSGGSSSGGGSSGGTSGTTEELTAVAAFWLDAREVTVAAFRRCAAAGACTLPAAGEGCTVHLGLEAHPATCVTLDQARAFCRWQKKRLPTTQEWTAAAAGAARRTFPWGEAPPAPDRLNACGSECASASMFASSDGQKATAPVGSFPRGGSPEGALDLAGNVAEWTESNADGLARGGSFEDVDVAAVSSTSARILDGAASLPSVGFRCASDH